MPLNLDARQRAMLEEMHVRVWWPLPAAEPAAPSPAPIPDPAPDATPPPQPQAPMSGLEGEGWPALLRRVAACGACGLCTGRQACVLRPAAPPAQRDWMVVGEPPNEAEERAGEAFAGEAGQLLDNMLRAVGVSRRADGAGGAWATNVVKCRPGIARVPQDDELLQCRAHLDQEIALVRPRVILAMGRFATLALLGPGNPALAGRPFGQLRGSVHAHAGVPVVVMQHPERLLRAPAQKAEAWADLCRALEIVRGREGT